MGKLKGILPLTGTFGNLSFIETRDGIVVKTKSAVPRKKLLEGKQYERSRENNSEFSAAARAGKLIRQAVSGGVIIQPDKGLMNRLNSRLIRAVKSDDTHGRGNRTATYGDLTLVRNIELNGAHRLYDQLFADYTISADRTAGTVTASFNSFFADCIVDAPKAATHYRIVLIAAALDFENNTWKKGIAYSDYIQHRAQQMDGFSLGAQLEAGNMLPVVAALAVEYYTFTGGLYYPLEMGALNPMAIVKSFRGEL